MRCFRSTPTVYESVRATLDAAYGYPNVQTKTETSIPPACELPCDKEGRVYLAVSDDECDYILPSQIIKELMASNAIEAVGEDEYFSVVGEQKATPCPGEGWTLDESTGTWVEANP